MEETECFWCEKVFEYEEEDVRFFEDENSNGEIFPHYEAVCTHCSEWSQV